MQCVISSQIYKIYKYFKNKVRYLKKLLKVTFLFYNLSGKPRSDQSRSCNPALDLGKMPSIANHNVSILLCMLYKVKV